MSKFWKCFLGVFFGMPLALGIIFGLFVASTTYPGIAMGIAIFLLLIAVSWFFAWAMTNHD